jgi:hypothetical protein
MGDIDPIIVKVFPPKLRKVLESHFFYRVTVFFYENGTQFFVRGVHYTGDGKIVPEIDPLGDPDVCSRDISYLQALGINLIYAYDATVGKDHTKCMDLFEHAQIYVWLFLATTEQYFYSINTTWDIDLYQSYTGLLDSFSPHANLFGYSIVTFNISQSNWTSSLAFPKAAIRDIKAYLHSKNYRYIPVGVSSRGTSLGALAAAYFRCGDVNNRSIELFGVDDWSCCGNSTFEESDYGKVTGLYGISACPYFFSSLRAQSVSLRKPHFRRSWCSVWPADVIGLVWRRCLDVARRRNGCAYSLHF